MEIVYFVGAFIVLTALSMHWHYRDRRQARKTDQIFRDRYEHNQTRPRQPCLQNPSTAESLTSPKRIFSVSNSGHGGCQEQTIPRK